MRQRELIILVIILYFDEKDGEIFKRPGKQVLGVRREPAHWLEN